MEPVTIATITGAAVSLLIPYLKSMGEGVAKKAGEKIGETAGETAINKATQLYTIIRAKFSKNDAQSVLDDLEKSPDDVDIQGAVKYHLKKFIDSDEDFAKELAVILKEAVDAGADTVFHTTIYGDVQKLVQMGNVYGDVQI